MRVRGEGEGLRGEGQTDGAIFATEAIVAVALRIEAHSVARTRVGTVGCSGKCDLASFENNVTNQIKTT